MKVARRERYSISWSRLTRCPGGSHERGSQDLADHIDQNPCGESFYNAARSRFRSQISPAYLCLNVKIGARHDRSEFCCGTSFIRNGTLLTARLNKLQFVELVRRRESSHRYVINLRVEIHDEIHNSITKDRVCKFRFLSKSFVQIKKHLPTTTRRKEERTCLSNPVVLRGASPMRAEQQL